MEARILWWGEPARFPGGGRRAGDSKTHLKAHGWRSRESGQCGKEGDKPESALSPRSQTALGAPGPYLPSARCPPGGRGALRRLVALPQHPALLSGCRSSQPAPFSSSWGSAPAPPASGRSVLHGFALPAFTVRSGSLQTAQAAVPARAWLPLPPRGPAPAPRPLSRPPPAAPAP